MRPQYAFLVLAGLSLALSGCDRQSPEAAQGAANAAGNGAITSGEVTPDEVTSGEVASSGNATAGSSSDETFKHVVYRNHKGTVMPDVRFTGPDNKPVTLAKIADGKPLLVNLWATWCAPCVAELPALDKLAGSPEAKGIKVITVSQDQGGAAHVEQFLAAHKFQHLARYLDPENALGFHYNTGTLPTTILYDGHGKEVARIVGALDWQSAEAAKLIAAMKQAS